jgi:23S rRNA (cytosine1962-C5)-methyltransferase
MSDSSLASLVDKAVAARAHLFDARHEAAFRLFNSHLEGDARFVLDVYAKTLVLHNHGAPLEDDDVTLRALLEQLLTQLPWLKTIIIKERKGATDQARQGRVLYSTAPHPNTWVREHGVRYAIDLLMNQDASLYLDTRLLRKWLIDNSDGKTVLNTFAYTGSLGVAARAGGAARVLHTDLNRRFLNVAKTSYALNGFPVDRKDFQTGDFWPFVNRLKKHDQRFDCVILDPPFFSSTQQGTVDLSQNAIRLVNKVRPVVRSEGKLVAVNNSLYVSGADYMKALERLCVDGWVSIDALVDVPEDITGNETTRHNEPVTDPAPFNHSTKIAILTVRHK